MQVKVLGLHGMGVNSEVFASHSGEFLSLSQTQLYVGLQTNATSKPISALYYPHITNSTLSMLVYSVTHRQELQIIMRVLICAGIPRLQLKG